jgi:hypothetical protein
MAAADGGALDIRESGRDRTEAHDERLADALAPANEVFGRLNRAVEEAVRDAPAARIDLLQVARDAGWISTRPS